MNEYTDTYEIIEVKTSTWDPDTSTEEVYDTEMGICNTCGAVVKDKVRHNEWHHKHDPEHYCLPPATVEVPRDAAPDVTTCASFTMKERIMDCNICAAPLTKKRTTDYSVVWCGEQKDGYTCTRSQGHSGSHIARVGRLGFIGEHAPGRNCGAAIHQIWE